MKYSALIFYQSKFKLPLRQAKNSE